MNEIISKPKNAVSFEKKANLTTGQKNIVKMLKDAIESGGIITITDIKRCYIESTTNYGVKRITDYKWDSERGQYRYSTESVILNEDHWQVQFSAMPWFQRNLGACIVKGRILAIPIIEQE